MQGSDLKVGVTFEMDGNIFTVVESHHVQQPRLAAFIRAKIKNVETGQVLEKRFNTGDKLGDAYIEKKEMQYLYEDGDLYYFMDVETYDQMPLDKKTVEEAMRFVKENGTVTIAFALNRIISVTPPLFVDLKIVECEPGVAGDSAKSAYKPATLETGYVVRVLLFINNEETIKIDTRTGDYVERVSV